MSVQARGFSAQLRGVGLWDLVQMECLARSRVVVRVVGEGGVGYLYFDRGRVMHAVTAHYAGERAALEILSWSNGSFQACDRAWPDRETPCARPVTQAPGWVSASLSGCPSCSVTHQAIIPK